MTSFLSLVQHDKALISTSLRQFEMFNSSSPGKPCKEKIQNS